MASLAVFICLISLSSTVVSVMSASVETIEVPSFGPESIAFDLSGAGPYTTVTDGRVLKYGGPDVGFVEYAYAAPDRSKSQCDGTNEPDLGFICGRPLGISFNYATKKLYIADAYHMLCSVGPEGGLATQLATISEGVPLKWLDGLDVDQHTGIVYFTDVSTVYNMSQMEEHISTGDATGRLLKYDPATGKVTTLMENMKGAGGVVVSEDSSFVLVSEFTGNKINKYWLTGPKAKTSELLIDVPGPANMKRTRSGQFWVATNAVNEASAVVPTAVRIDESGKILESLPFGEPYTNAYINDVHERDGALYIGSIFVNFVGIYRDLKLSNAAHEEL